MKKRVFSETVDEYQAIEYAAMHGKNILSYWTVDYYLDDHGISNGGPDTDFEWSSRRKRLSSGDFPSESNCVKTRPVSGKQDAEKETKPVSVKLEAVKETKPVSRPQDEDEKWNLFCVSVKTGSSDDDRFYFRSIKEADTFRNSFVSAGKPVKTAVKKKDALKRLLLTSNKIRKLA